MPESDGLIVAVISQRQHRRVRFSIKGEPSSRRRQLTSDEQRVGLIDPKRRTVALRVGLIDRITDECCPKKAHTSRKTPSPALPPG